MSPVSPTLPLAAAMVPILCYDPPKLSPRPLQRLAPRQLPIPTRSKQFAAYQRAADLDPSEPNLFNWGAELLTHRASDQAVEVFADGHRLFPRSTRTLLGLAVALYSRGSYDQAAQRFFEAADLDASDPAPYLFLGKISSRAITGPGRLRPTYAALRTASPRKRLGELLLCGHTDRQRSIPSSGLAR